MNGDPRPAHPRLVGVPRLLPLLLLAAGCGSRDDELLIATPWPAAAQVDLASGFRDWAAARPGAAVGPIRITWIPLEPGDDPARVVRRAHPPDILLGAPSSAYRTLARDRWLAPVERTSHPLWCVARKTTLATALNKSSLDTNTFTFNDFRTDPVALAWAAGELGSGSWAEAYERLLRAAGKVSSIGRGPGVALAVVERGEAARTPIPMPAPGPGRVAAVPPGLVVTPVENEAAWLEGVAVVRGGKNPSLAQEFLRFLADRGQAGPPPSVEFGDPGLDAEALLADLLGATLVDSREELHAAWQQLELAGHPRRAERWMTQAPPWPPASIGEIVKTGGTRDGGALLDALGREIAPEADLRAWLWRSWLEPPRPIDGGLLADLAAAAGGRLMREPRFRAWLRAEWTAWARQRYRRVARLAEARGPFP